MVELWLIAAPLDQASMQAMKKLSSPISKAGLAHSFKFTVPELKVRAGVESTAFIPAQAALHVYAHLKAPNATLGWMKYKCVSTLKVKIYLTVNLCSGVLRDRADCWGMFM